MCVICVAVVFVGGVGTTCSDVYDICRTRNDSEVYDIAPEILVMCMICIVKMFVGS